MRKTVLVLVVILLLGQVFPAFSELYMDQEPPAEWADRTDILRLTAFQTLENDCFLMEAGGKSMLIDGGVNKWRFLLRDALKELDRWHVDVIFNTHPHDDHLECVYWLLKMGLTADEFWSGFEKTYGNELQRQTVHQLDKMGIPYHQLSQYETVDFGGATLVFYWWEEGDDPNACSVQMHVTFGESTMLLTADIGGNAERHLLDEVPPELLKADILKYPHHAIRQTYPEYMDAVDPLFAFVTNRKINVYDAYRQLDSRGIQVCYTTAGRLVLVTDGKDWYVKQYKEHF